jgi:penicillin-binding protein 1A
MDNRKVMIGGTSGILGEWAREEANTPFEGTVTAKDALVKSKNSATVRLGMQIGTDLKTSLDAVIALSATAGIQSQPRSYPATFLGSTEVSLMDLALAYTTFPGGGSRPKKTFLIERIKDSSGRAIYKETTSRVPVLKPGTAYQITDALSTALSEGTGSKAFSTYGLKRLPLAGKTGTAYDFTDVWFMGYSSELTCGVWAGFDKSRVPIYFGAFGNVGRSRPLCGAITSCCRPSIGALAACLRSGLSMILRQR